MEKLIPRRSFLKTIGKALSVTSAALILRPAKSVAEKVNPSLKIKLEHLGTHIDYDPYQHSWIMAVDIEKCIGCGLCVEACKNENNVIKEPFYFRTWVERYIVKKAAPGSGHAQGETIIDSPNGAMNGFPASATPKSEILKSFFVPKLCNHCVDSPCTQVCPVGATFESPDGVVLVDPNYCIGCGFCVQACPYGCRFLNPNTGTAEKCTMCYHRITRGLKPACVEVCPTQARLFGDLKNPVENDPIAEFMATKKTAVLKPHLNTGARLQYAGLDKEVR